MKSLIPAFLFIISATAYAQAEDSRPALDLLASEVEWLPASAANWRFEQGAIVGRTPLFDGEKTDPAASAFLQSRRTFGGTRKHVDVDVEFERGRYLGVYLDYDPDTESGIWMATGHVLPADEQEHHVASAYIKTVERGHWIVRATGELDVPAKTRVSLRFEREGEDYRVWQGDRLVATYRKPGGYPPGKLQLRLVNAAARLTRVTVVAETISDSPDTMSSGLNADRLPVE